VVRQNDCVLLSELVRTSSVVAGASARRVKIAELAGLLRRAEPGEIGLAVAFASGELRQRQIGVGYAALSELLRPGPAADTGRADTGATDTGATDTGTAGTGALTLARLDAAFAAIGAVSGPGSQAERRRLLDSLFAQATPAERSFLGRLLTGELRQGAQEGVLTEAVAQAAGVPAGQVRRAVLLGGSLPAVAEAALSAAARATAAAGAGTTTLGASSPDGGGAGGPGAGAAALATPAAEGAAAASATLGAFRLEVGRPLRPMLAASAPTVAAAFERLNPAAVEWKIDGIRIQVHRRGPEVRVFTRSLDDITSRLPEITAAARRSPAQAMVLDGEAIALSPDGRARPFQVTASRAGTQEAPGEGAPSTPLTPFFFDLLHLDGRDLVDEPAAVRQDLLATVLPADLRVPRLVTGDPAAAERFFADAVGRGHEGVVVKALDSPYAAGRRGSDWIKVKPRHTLDLVVLAAEWGHGRRRGWLSNLHLGARDPETGAFVMLGKTFKGLTDQMLGWQTERLLELAEPPGHGGGAGGPAAGPDAPGAGAALDRRAAWGVVQVRPELVVEIAFDGVQSSPRYPGGLALRFARVLRHRPDKPAAEADTIGTIRAIWADAGNAG
jgi:ATP-dependent DNA ligase